MTNEFSLSTYVRNRFDGLLVIGDVHSDLESLVKAYELARSENYFLMSLGDLVDRGSSPYEVVELMAQVIYDGAGGFVIGNHDDKFSRYSRGNKVQLSVEAKQTIELVTDERMPKFLELYNSIMDDTMLSGIYHTFDNITLTHAASHPEMWENAGLTKTARARALVGETNGEVYPDGYPVRLYDWIEEIPTGKTVIVGHDRMPIHNVPITTPLVKNNKNNGKVVFVDTGCSKGGFLSAAVILNSKSGFKLDSFVEFK